MRTSFFTLISVLLFSCNPSETTEEIEPNFKPRIFAVTVSDVNKSMDWYTSVLGFERDTISHFESSGITVGMMHLGEFFIELVGFNNSISKSELNLPQPYSNLHGFFKLGFQANDISTLFQRLDGRDDVDMIAPLDGLPEIENYEFPDQYFLITDPDGNYIQFFSRKPNQPQLTHALTPFLIAISTPDIDATIAWYAQHLEAQPVGSKVGQPGNERILMDKNGFLIELGEFADDISFDVLEAPDGVDRSRVQGIAKLSFLVEDINSIYQRMKEAEIHFDFDLTESKSLGGDRFFMAKDLNGASLQFFEVDN